MSIQSSFTETGVSAIVGRGPIFYRLNCSSFGSGQIDYYFGKGTLDQQPRNALILTGTWTGTVDIEFSKDQALWTAVPGESYTANAARFFNG
jgi:hypothetical protein